MDNSMKKNLLDKLLPWREAVNLRLAELQPWSSSPVLDRVISHAVENGGKRLRGILTLAAGEVFGPRIPALLDVAASVELLHIASLLLDDHPSMDNASKRRGKPALHRTFSPDMAVLTAHSLVSLALHLPTQTAIADDRCRIIIAELTRCIGPYGMASGQARDLNGCTEGGHQDIIRVATDKTGLLFAAAACVGAIAGGADDNQQAALREYGMHLGTAYQIADDLTDMIDEDHPGRCVNVAVALGTEAAKTEFRIQVEMARHRAEQVARSETLNDLIELVNAHV